jgi:anthranilate synthase component 2
MLLMIDNYDSFTYILVQYFRMLGVEMSVYRNDAITVDKIAELAPAAIVLSPGPGSPGGAGITLPVIEHFAGKVPLLGVCLGHQAIGQVFGGRVVRAARLMHGKTSLIHHDQTGLFTGMPQPFRATRYHSLILDPQAIPSCLAVSAWTEQGEIMALRHRTLPIDGVQFHPESILTDRGIRLLRNFLRINRIAPLKGVSEFASVN